MKTKSPPHTPTVTREGRSYKLVCSCMEWTDSHTEVGELQPRWRRLHVVGGEKRR